MADDIEVYRDSRWGGDRGGFFSNGSVKQYAPWAAGGVGIILLVVIGIWVWKKHKGGGLGLKSSGGGSSSSFGSSISSSPSLDITEMEEEFHKEHKHHSVSFEINEYGSLAYSIMTRTFEPSMTEEQRKYIEEARTFPGSPTEIPPFFSDISIYEHYDFPNPEDYVGKDEKYQDEVKNVKEKRFKHLLKSGKAVAKEVSQEALNMLSDKKIEGLLFVVYNVLEYNLSRFKSEILAGEETRLKKVLDLWDSHKSTIKHCLKDMEDWSGRKMVPIRISFMANKKYGNHLVGYGLKDNKLHVMLGQTNLDYMVIFHEASHAYTRLPYNFQKYLNDNCKDSWWANGDMEKAYGTPSGVFIDSWTRACQYHIYECAFLHRGIKDVQHKYFKSASNETEFREILTEMAKEGRPFGCTKPILDALRASLPMVDKEGNIIKYSIKDHQEFIRTFIENNGDMLISNTRPYA